VATKQLTIVDFMKELKLLEGSELSLAQRTIHKATYGLELSPAELDIFRRATGREIYEPREHQEATVIAGRQGGKTSHVGAPIAVYEACRDHGLKRGERAYVLLIAPVTKQAQIAFRFIRNFFLCSPPLKKKVVKMRMNEIDLDNGITIACYPCSQITIRGLRVVAAILDELGFWRDEITAANPAEDVLNALRPAMATFANHKLIKISTPYRKEGVLWRDYKERAELDYLVWQLSSAEMNPRISPDFLEKERRRDEESYRREYLAQFTDHITGWIGFETLEQCVIKSCTERPPVTDAIYAASVDPAFKGDDFALAIAHRLPDGTIILDYTATWTGTREAPLGYEWVCREIARILKLYGQNALVGDQYCAAIIEQEFLKLGIRFQAVSFGSRTRLDLFGNLKHLLIQGKIQILDKPELLRQLRSLEEHKTNRGDIEIRSAYGVKDDLAVVVALAAFQLSKIDVGPTPFVLGRVPRPWDGRIKPYDHDPWARESRYSLNVDPDPATCFRQAFCENFPYCLDEGYCLGFKDDGRSK
jgi:hypothetical protein